MRLGIIGAGLIVQEFLPDLQAICGIEIVAILGRREHKEAVEALCVSHGIAHAVYDFDALCALGMDAVYVAVPNILHFPYCKMALERGIHVIVEKPMASNEKEAVELARIARKHQVFLFEAVTTHYLGNFKKIQEWLPRIGTIKLVQSQYSQYSRRYDAFRKGEVLPVFDPEKAGGALMDLNLYNLHFVMGLFGEPKQSHYYANVERGIDTSGILVLEYPDFQAVCIAAKDCGGMSGAVIQGTDGWIKTDLAVNRIGRVTLERNDGTREIFDDHMGEKRAVPEFEAFVRAITQKDFAFSWKMLEKSVAVSRVQTKARMDAGIFFPGEERL